MKDLTLFSTLLLAGSARFKDLTTESLTLVSGAGEGGAESRLLFDFSTYTCIFSGHSFTF